MSGGRFDYVQYRMDEVADDIQQEINNSGRKLTDEEKEYYEWDTDTHREYPPEVIEKFKEAVEAIRKARIYMHRVDWLISGDDGNDSFLERLKDDLWNHSEQH